MQSLVAVNAV